MTYIDEYFELINNSKQTKSHSYTEKHHILPKSIFNDEIAKDLLLIDQLIKDFDDKRNIVKLSAKDHFFAHLLLVKIFKGVSSNCYERMVYAANFMMSRTNNADEYKRLRKAYSKVLTKTLKGKTSRALGCKWSEEAKRKKSLNHPMRGKTYEEYYGKSKSDKLKKMRSETHKGKKVSIETRKKLSEKQKEYFSNSKNREKLSNRNKGQIPWNKGLTSEDHPSIKAHNLDQTLYGFINIKTGEEIFARKIDMKKKYGCNRMHIIIRDKNRSSKGWKFTGKIEGK